MTIDQNANITVLYQGTDSNMTQLANTIAARADVNCVTGPNARQEARAAIQRGSGVELILDRNQDLYDICVSGQQDSALADALYQELSADQVFGAAVRRTETFPQGVSRAPVAGAGLTVTPEVLRDFYPRRPQADRTNYRVFVGTSEQVLRYFATECPEIQEAAGNARERAQQQRRRNPFTAIRDDFEAGIREVGGWFNFGDRE